MALRFDKNKNEKKRINVKVIATGVVAITLIGIVGISIGKFSSGSPVNLGVASDAITSVGKGINDGFSFIKNGFKDVANFKDNSKKVKKLEEENEKLKKDMIALNAKLDKTESLEELKKTLNFVQEEYKATSISASVVGKNDGNWYESFVIGAGKNSGVKKESIVMNGSGLVGIVYEVSNNYSKAISLLDSKASVSFKLAKDANAKGTITQNTTLDNKDSYNSKGYLQGYMFDSSYNVIQGDIITTSGLGFFPDGIPIGEVEKVVDDKDKSLKYVVVKPYVDFKNINDVVVIEPRNIG
ncbi:TPA: rod shape-determining protein MreC [Clostridioides difficile]|uniref:Cell shape-determining protein MreC n=2 Tax=Clostridioides difficile TaxID=1496 RepID=A0A9R0BJ49_CLODR|nr:rod shape-determining protein MreC [Clostridioides difficile]EQG59154.1 rod shape-determining protein MreC [Clostridioides difficile DA00145]OFU00742.1 rod shape-determining protein MreC [Clostridium sp. HMSC19E03]OFU00859.1 rod shape-determining protein MreC [Clostridium sp. HMSC19D07]OFU14830.1 rod shape-determining protein MreC [Clostridium sp. HMSC19C09]OFU21444.1 rod shape-determining protein MreC [Clostridium sp. HMSC19C08]OFU25943.1 rod shape-determining protein MreC [Clostridium sp